MIRRGEMIMIKPRAGGLQALSCEPVAGRQQMIKACNIRNYSSFSAATICSRTMNMDDFEADMTKMAADPATQKWWDLVKPLMQPLEDRRRRILGLDGGSLSS